MAEKDGVPTTAPPSTKPHPPPHRPSITLPPRSGIESFFSGSGFGFSPGPMTLLSTLFPDGDHDSDCRSFSQLLAGAMASPRPPQEPPSASVNGGSDHFRFEANRPAGLVVSQPVQRGVFTIPPGLSPASLLDSPGLFPGQGPFGMSHQQALAQVTAHAAQAQTNVHMQGIGAQPSGPFPTLTSGSTQQNVLHSALGSRQLQESSQFSNADQRTQPSSIIVDKPADDGYNWRKYGQKQVKGSEYPRSYYKCTHPDCPVKKQVERSLDGQVTEIIYKGKHNHQPPQKRSKDGGNNASGNQGNAEHTLPAETRKISSTCEIVTYPCPKRDEESSQATGNHATSDEEEVGNDGTREFKVEEEVEPAAKRRDTRVVVSEKAASHRTVTEPRIIVQTTSEVDLLDDGYRWRKYGQKLVKGNAYPRSYYKCTSQGCNVRKQVERAAKDPKAVMTTYEGRHNHELPAARTSSHSTATANNHNNNNNNNGALLQLRPHNSGIHDNASYIGTSNAQQPVALLRLKEERIT